jgi:hypothetical protein
MRWAVEYTTATGMIGLCIFTAADIEAAEKYVTEMKTKYGHSNVFNLTPLPSGAGIDELYRLFPRLADRVQENGMPTRRHG